MGGRLYFGFTPRLRLFYDFAIKDGYKQELPEYDYAKSLFGCINNGNVTASFKSKTSFSDAVIEEKSFPGIINDKVILGEPKPSSYLDYLDQTNGTVTYNSKGFKLRGAKQYWLRNEIYHPKQSGNNENVKSECVGEGYFFDTEINAITACTTDNSKFYMNITNNKRICFKDDYDCPNGYQDYNETSKECKFLKKLNEEINQMIDNDLLKNFTDKDDSIEKK